MVRATALAVGAATFAAAHAIESAAWRSLFAPSSEFAPWFLNSGRAAAFTAACLFFVSLVYGWGRRARRSPWFIDAANLTIGASAAMTVVLALIGAGTIFPLVLAFGVVIVAAACAAGTIIGSNL